MDKNEIALNLNLVFSITLIYFFIELIGGFYYNSLALITDASFMAINILGQIIAIFAEKLSKRPADDWHPFGYERIKVISALFNGILVGFVLFYIFIDAFKRIVNPEPIEADKVLIIAIIGLLVNAFGVYKLYKHSEDINIKGAFIHILQDLLGSVGVIISSVIIKFTNLYLIDALASIFISFLVAYPTYLLIKDSIYILMEGNPAKIKKEDISKFLYSHFPFIANIKDTRIWALTPDKLIALLRVRTKDKNYDREKIKLIKEQLKKQFGFFDVYIELYEEG
ncbi:cation diffusion facilitator family transporter [Venenivibrio stagnispumantis]|uniref:Cobalt-zinc-cadmium efflux system protein n=1 Tax=Venenivibrio stagnispumantis TaxID=407998 RepID=A0AA46AFV0_9AQUI|nr:cation diffusion facilitator family transporter [Venenivibrio stagnispumantis]MCW4572686.1 cation diffusion facilitator family transporter [Venenivibrio stagnispumantis]SMP21424.1 cobalt-zinc-cadmium efflux system protein [Venenivibrio stagnispumantis]